MNKSSLAVTLWLALISVAPPIAEAQDNDGLLRDLPGVHLLIERLSDDAKRCGVNADEIKSAAMYPLSGSALKINDMKQYWTPTFYINVTTTNVTGVCSSAIYIRVYHSQNLKLSYAKIENLLPVVLWWSLLQVVTPTAQHGQRVQRGVETLTKDFITAWNLDNKK